MQQGLTAHFCDDAELYIGIFAVLKAGAAYIPMDPEYPADRLIIMAEDSEVRSASFGPGCQSAVDFSMLLGSR